MMHPMVRAAVAGVGLLASSLVCRAEVSIRQADDKSVAVTTGVYTAKIDSKGNLAELAVKGAKAFTHTFGDPGKPPAEPPSINVVNHMVAMRSGPARVEWTFGEDTLGFLSQGYNFECTLDASVKSIMTAGGKGGPLGQYNGGATGLILANGLTVANAKAAMHVHGRRYIPAEYISGGVKPGSLIEHELRLGSPAGGAEFLGGITIAALGPSTAELAEGGNAGGGFPHFPRSAPIGFTTTQETVGTSEFPLEYRASIVDHYVAGKEVFAGKQAATLPPQGGTRVEWSVPPLPPGFYYLTVSAWQGEQKLTETKQTFTVDLPHYTRPLTRPADWDAFWARQEKLLAETPGNPRLAEIGAKALAGKVFEVSLDMPGGRTLRGCLVVPGKPTGPAGFGSLTADRLQSDIATRAKDGSLALPKGVQFTIALPADATYTRWNSADDNNLLDCVLWYLRGIDFLAMRPEVKPDRILVSGASRSGPLAVIAAARRPRNVCGVSAFVHTSAGISWTDKPYLSWGLPGGHNPADAGKVARLAAMAAYVDPVNHALDVTCPIWFGWGLDDGLSQPQGIEAMYHLCRSKWKRISRDAGGHQYSGGMKQLAAELQALLDAGGGIDQSGTLEDH
jgi:cephalosporin-C deacetylase-like acetyl esterase